MNSERRSGNLAGAPSDVLTRPARPPDLVLRYGDGADHVADVHLPPVAAAQRAGTGGRALLTIFIHGGFWRAEYGREHTRPLAEALAAAGFVVCAPEYRRTGQPGGGWPGTFDDVAAAADRLPGLVAEATRGAVDADPGRAVLAGHSAGRPACALGGQQAPAPGQLALVCRAIRVAWRRGPGGSQRSGRELPQGAWASGRGRPDGRRACAVRRRAVPGGRSLAAGSRRGAGVAGSRDGGRSSSVPDELGLRQVGPGCRGPRRGRDLSCCCLAPGISR